MSGLLWFNGIDAETLGFYLTDAPDLLAEGGTTPQTVAFPQGTGSLLSTAPVAVGSRSLRLSGYCTSNTVAGAATVLHRIKSAIGSGLVEIRSAWQPTLVVRGVLVSHSAGPSSSAWLGQVRIDLDFLLPDPYAYAIAPSVVAFGATATAIPLGTAPSRGRAEWSAIITITGAATTPTLTESDATGTALRTMVFTSSPTASDAIEIDCGRGTVTTITAGVRTNGLGTLTAGWEFPRLDPADGDWYTSAWPKLAVSSGTATIRYYEAYR